MNAEFLRTCRLQLDKSLFHLFLGHAVFGLAGVVHDLHLVLAFAQLEHAAGIVAAADGFGNAANLLDKRHMRVVVKVDVRAEVICLLHILHRRDVGAEHDVGAGDAARLAEHQLGVGRAVHTAAFLLQNLHQIGVRRRLDGKILLVTLVPAERRVERTCVFPDTLFVIHMERRRDIPDDLLRLFQRQKRLFFHCYSSSVIYSSITSFISSTPVPSTAENGMS